MTDKGVQNDRETRCVLELEPIVRVARLASRYEKLSICFPYFQILHYLILKR